MYPFNNIKQYKITNEWDNLSQMQNDKRDGFTITIDLPICQNAIFVLSARLNWAEAGWTHTLNSGDLEIFELASKGTTWKTNYATLTTLYIVSSKSGCNITFNSNDNDFWSVKNAMLLEC